MATTTAGNVLAIQGVPEADWDARVALLQRYVSAGQVIGLVAAEDWPSGPWPGVCGCGRRFAGRRCVGDCHGASRSATRADQQATAETNGGGRCRYHGTAHRAHHVSLQELRSFLAVITQPLRRFLIVWLIAYPAMNGFATMFPVAMTRESGWKRCCHRAPMP